MADRAGHPAFNNYATAAMIQQQQHQLQQQRQQQQQQLGMPLAHQISQRAQAQMQNIPGVGQDNNTFWVDFKQVHQTGAQQSGDEQGIQQANIGQPVCDFTFDHFIPSSALVFAVGVLAFSQRGP